MSEKFFKEVEEAIAKARALNDEALKISIEINNEKEKHHFLTTIYLHALYNFRVNVEDARARIAESFSKNESAYRNALDSEIEIDREFLYNESAAGLRYHRPVISSTEDERIKAELEKFLGKFFGKHKISNLLNVLESEIKSIEKLEDETTPLERKIDELCAERDAILRDLAELRNKLNSILKEAGL